MVSPDLATIIQEIVGTDSGPTSWVSGNNLALILNGNGGTGERELYSDNNGGATDVYGANARPVLRVIFSSGTTVTKFEAQVDSGNDDAEQRSGDTTNNYATSSDLELVTEAGTTVRRPQIRFHL